MLINFDEISPAAAYHIMVQTIIPRPIAWVLSDNGNDSCNLAPFSYFNGITGNPPLLMISVGRKADGSRKDTWVNIDVREHFVLHIAHREQAEAMVTTAASLPHGESELEAAKLSVADVANWSLPRVVGPHIAMFCRKHQIIEIGDTPQGLVIGRIEAMWLDDDVATESADGRIAVDAAKVDPLARLGGSDYALFGEQLTIARPR